MRLLIINQYFPPDRAASSILLGQLAEDLSKTFETSVVCGTPTYDPDPTLEVRSVGLRTHRIPLFAANRTNLMARLLNYFIFLIGAVLRSFTLPRADLILCFTDPPLAGLVGVLVKRLRRGKLVFVSQDVYPEIVQAVGRMNHPWTVALLRWTSTVILSHADRIVVLGEDMKERLIQKGAALNRVVIIPNWQDLDRLRPSDGGRFRDENQIPRTAFLVMHSGNIGFSQDLDSFMAAAQLTQDDPTILYAIVGGGTRKDRLEAEVRTRGLSNVRFLPYQPSERLSESLSAADLHYVSLLPSLKGLIVPSKIYGILAVGRPVLANVPKGSEIERIVRETHCGVCTEATGASTAEAIRSLRQRPDLLKALGENARRWAETHGGRDQATTRYRELLLELSPCEISSTSAQG